MAIRNDYKSNGWRFGHARVLAAVLAAGLITACSSPEPEIPETPVEVFTTPEEIRTKLQDIDLAAATGDVAEYVGSGRCGRAA